MFGVIYSKVTGRIRWWIKPDNDNVLDNIKLQDGEAFLKLDDSLYGDVLKLQDIIFQQTGLSPSNDRYAIVDANGNVTGALIADPLCGDSIKDCQLIAHDKAGVGWTYDVNKGFTEPPILLRTSDEDAVILKYHSRDDKTVFTQQEMDLLKGLGITL